jgi:myotubularin-related protein 9
MRSSQPLLGSSNRRCKEDEQLLKSALPIGKKGIIFDLRDSGVLKSAASKGGGYETDANYPLWKKVNKHLDRYEQLQQSFVKLVDACLGESGQFLAKLESSGWLNNIRQAMHASFLIADELHNKSSCVLVHGWDGWDNTLLVCSLVQLILNPESRSLRGFIRLIEREWLQAGHQFSRRCFKSAFGSSSIKLEGPVFLLFLDCVRHFLEQFSLSFEFNQHLLVTLFDNAYTSEYGTFLGNCQKERHQLQLASRTVSLWTHIFSNQSTFTNPLYEPNEAALWPSLFSQSMCIWSSLFLRNQKNENPLREADTEITKMVEANKQARLRVQKLRK